MLLQAYVQLHHIELLWIIFSVLIMEEGTIHAQKIILYLLSLIRFPMNLLDYSVTVGLLLHIDSCHRVMLY